jgi:molybdopterin-containing oxidoreductase family iron-sulfur binding subunit
MGASLALAGSVGCRYREEKIVPLAARPENWVPGKPQRYATSIEWAGAPRHLLVTCYDGRPIKVEGNPDHPYSRGATDAFAQASVLDLYDPDRSGELRQRTNGQMFAKAWEDFAAFAGQHFGALKQAGGQGLCILFEPTESASVHAILAAMKADFPQVELFGYTPLSRDNEQAGSQLAFWKPYRTHFALDQAQIIACLDADLLGEHPASVRLARGFVTGRDPEAGRMNRLYAVESQFSITGVMADHRLALRSVDIASFMDELGTRVHSALDGGKPQPVEKSGSKRERVLRALVSDLVAHRGASVIAVGPKQPARVQAQAHALNALLGNVGKTVFYTEEPTGKYEVASGGLRRLVDRMRDDHVDTLLILGGNPVYDAPADLQFAEALSKVKHAIHLSVYDNETSQKCQWHLPQTHPFEAWGDCPAFDGTICVSQPLIAPLLGGKSAVELLAVIVGEKADAQAIVRRSVEKAAGRSLSDKDWQRLLHDGFLANSNLGFLTPMVRPVEIERVASTSGEAFIAAEEGEPVRSQTRVVGEDELELVFCRSDNVYDGRFANNGWLQETPHLLTKLTWDNAAIISPSTAAKLGVEHGTVVKLELAGRSVEIPAFVLPGQAPGSIGVALGYGRTAAGLVGGSVADRVEPVGVHVSVLRSSQAMYIATGLKVTPTGRKWTLATTQEHHAIDKVGLEAVGHRVGEIVREATYQHYKAHPDFAQHVGHQPPLESLWKDLSYDGQHAWGMSIDLNKCIGCNACLVACQAENNVPIVGKEQVRRGREMHWIRVDRYFRGADADDEDLQVVHQPMTCHHCETAPCEQVCPVAATVHSTEGLNDMAYNRCIGTRYCANNCPYKVRRFNYLNFNKHLEDPNRQLVQLVVNPEVTVRHRGVMEKCTFCVQRIQNGKIEARNEGRPIRDGEIQSACQQACPTRAIEFGDLRQGNSRVAKEHENPRAYALLAELNVRPRTRYLARIRNPHPGLAAEDGHETDPGHGV